MRGVYRQETGAAAPIYQCGCVHRFILDVFHYSNVLLHPWVQGWKVHSFEQFPWWFLDIDAAKQVAVK